ncbi:MAG: hypothetical protein HQL51_09385 [Magnetococcales bacterium]|nr:hypothetical protein [Magnetococcales bacterium]
MFPKDGGSNREWADQLEERGNPVSARFLRQLDDLQQRLEGRFSRPGMVHSDPQRDAAEFDAFNQLVELHHRAINHFDTLASHGSTRGRIPYHMALFHRDNGDLEGAKAWAAINRQQNQKTVELPEDPMDPLLKTFAQASKVNPGMPQGKPGVRGIQSSPFGVHDRDAGIFYPSPEAVGRHPWDLEPVDAVALPGDYSHLDLFEPDEKNQRPFDAIYANRRDINALRRIYAIQSAPPSRCGPDGDCEAAKAPNYAQFTDEYAQVLDLGLNPDEEEEEATSPYHAASSYRQRGY